MTDHLGLCITTCYPGVQDFSCFMKTLWGNFPSGLPKHIVQEIKLPHSDVHIALTSVMEVQCTRLKPPWSFSVCWKSPRPVNAPSWFLSCSSIKKLFKCEDCLLPWKDIPSLQAVFTCLLPEHAGYSLPCLLRTLLFLPFFLCTWSNIYSCWPQHSFPTLRNGHGLFPRKARGQMGQIQTKVLNKGVWAGVRARLVKFLTSGMRTQVL